MRIAAMHSGGKTIQLQAGHYQAKIVTVGAGLAELTHHGRHVVIPHKPEEMPLAHLGKILVPWPNRIANGCYQYNGKAFQLAVNDLASQSAIHGLLAWRDWQINQQSASEASLMIFLPPSYGYPFSLLVEVMYRLDAIGGLHVYISTLNIGDQPAPYGSGAHPYLTCDLEKIDSCTLTLPANEVLGIDPQELHRVEHTELNFTTPRPIAATQIDHTFKTTAPDDEWEVRMFSAAKKMTTYLRCDQPWLQVYSGEKLNRLGLAVEPMTCPPDTFNSGIGLISLAPGEMHRMRFLIGAE
ncbi:aldose-1-epimerase [Klebsiella huaxiensis]